MKLLIIILFVSSNILLSQDREWVPKSFDSLDVQPKSEIYDDEEVNMDYTKGYFPIPVYTALNVGLYMEGSYLLSSASGISPSGLKPIGGTYSNSYNKDTDYLKFKKKFSDDEESTYITSEGYSIGLDFKLTPNIGIPVVFRATAIITWNTDVLYHLDNSKSFLDDDNKTRDYLEINNLLLEETQLELKGGISIPLYGVFISKQMQMSNLFSLYIGVSNSIVLSSEATQYAQIGDVKDKLRFENGLDTLVQTSNIELPSLIKNRLGLEFGLETSFEVMGYGANFGLKGLIPTESIVSDESWKQYQFRIGVSIYFGGLFK